MNKMKNLLSTLLIIMVIAISGLSAQDRVYPPNPQEPSNGAGGQMPDVILNWGAVAGTGGIVQYELQLDITDAFDTPDIFDLTEFTGIRMEDLLFDQEYFWRVRAIEGDDISGWSEIFSFTVFDAPALNKPNANASNQNPNVLLACRDRIGPIIITGVDYFEFEADTSANFDSPALFHKTNTFYEVNTSFLLFGEEYYWRARVGHAADISDWSEVRTFTVLETVTLDKPNNNSVDMGLKNNLTWKAISGVINYTIEIADNDGFTGATSMIIEGLSYTTDGYLHFGNQYFWRVRANHASDTSVWSEVRNFTVINTVNLTSPANEATGTPINPRLEWAPVTGVDYFHLQYNTSPVFTDPCCDDTIQGSANFYQVVLILEKGTTYYWRCRAVHALDTTQWSNVWSFTTEEEIGIGETAFDSGNINIFPNPTGGVLHIDIRETDNPLVKMHVMDLLGQIHLEAEISIVQGSTMHTFDLGKLANGIYILRLSSGTQTYSQKITIHR